MCGRTENLPGHDVGVNDSAIVADDQVTQHLDFARGLIHFDDRGVGACGKRELRANQAIGPWDDVRLGMRKGVVVRRLQAGFHIVGDQMLVVVGNPPKLGESNFFRSGSGNLDGSVFNRELRRIDSENVPGEFENFLAEPGRRPVYRTDVVEVKIISAVRGRDAPR